MRQCIGLPHYFADCAKVAFKIPIPVIQHAAGLHFAAQEQQEVRGKSPGLCQTDAILVTCRQPFSEEIIFPALGVAKVGVSLRWREGGIDLESAGSTRPTAVYGAFIERNRLV